MVPPPNVPPLPFNWRNFVPAFPPKCFPACIAMCNKYWLTHDSSLDIPSEIHELEKELGDSFYSKLGLSAERLRQAMKKKKIRDLDGERFEVGLTVEIRNPDSLESLYPFFLEDPPIPLIISFDKSFTEQGRPADPHAVIVYSINYKQEKINVIDPAKGDLKGAFPYDFFRFNLGWGRCENLTFIVAPLDTLKLISGQEVKVIRQTTLKRFE